jgi:hypothetical protein
MDLKDNRSNHVDFKELLNLTWRKRPGSHYAVARGGYQLLAYFMSFRSQAHRDHQSITWEYAKGNRKTLKTSDFQVSEPPLDHLPPEQ